MQAKSARPLVWAILPWLLILGGCANVQPPTLGVQDGQLLPCPDMPNCVVSRADASLQHRVSPIGYGSDRQRAYAVIETLLENDPQVIITERRPPHYLRAEFASRWLHFIDDVEFYFPPEPHIEIRSASRVGYSDFGVNRKRMERIREAFTQAYFAP